jgi:hypothetical protein
VVGPVKLGVHPGELSVQAWPPLANSTALAGVWRRTIGPQPTLHDSGEYREDPADDWDLQRHALCIWRDHGRICAAEQVGELAGVGDRLIAEAVVYARLSAALTWVFAGRS